MLLTWLYVAHEISFDTFRPGADRTYRVLRQLTTPYKMDFQIDTHGALTPKMIESIAEIESANRIHPGHRWVQYRQFAQRRAFWYTDSQLSRILGDQIKAWRSPQSSQTTWRCGHLARSHCRILPDRGRPHGQSARMSGPRLHCHWYFRRATAQHAF